MMLKEDLMPIQARNLLNFLFVVNSFGFTDLMHGNDFAKGKTVDAETVFLHEYKAGVRRQLTSLYNFEIDSFLLTLVL
jgi:hypothetical protein